MTNPNQYPPRSDSNGLGIAGFIVSLVGYMTCGFLCPLGVLLSAIALRKPPRGLATAGLIIGLIGTIIPALVLMVYGAIVFTFCFALSAGLPEASTQLDLAVASQKVMQYQHAHGALPDEATGEGLVEPLHDYWGHPLHYARTPSGFEIRSAGPDGMFGTGDDRVRNEAGTVTSPAAR